MDEVNWLLVDEWIMELMFKTQHHVFLFWEHTTDKYVILHFDRIPSNALTLK